MKFLIEFAMWFMSMILAPFMMNDEKDIDSLGNDTSQRVSIELTPFKKRNRNLSNRYKSLKNKSKEILRKVDRYKRNEIIVLLKDM